MLEQTLGLQNDFLNYNRVYDRASGPLTQATMFVDSLAKENLMLIRGEGGPTGQEKSREMLRMC